MEFHTIVLNLVRHSHIFQFNIRHASDTTKVAVSRGNQWKIFEYVSNANDQLRDGEGILCVHIIALHFTFRLINVILSNGCFYAILQMCVENISAKARQLRIQKRMRVKSERTENRGIHALCTIYGVSYATISRSPKMLVSKPIASLRSSNVLLGEIENRSSETSAAYAQNINKISRLLLNYRISCKDSIHLYRVYLINVSSVYHCNNSQKGKDCCIPVYSNHFDTYVI